MTYGKLIGLLTSVICATTLMADKPVWAGNGGKPSKYEKEDHKREMISKHKDKKDKDYKKNDHDREYSSQRDRDSKYDSTHDRHNDIKYEGQGKTDGEYIEEKTDETKKNWIGKFFDFLN